MLVMFWAIRFNDSYDLLDDENSLTLSPMSLLRQSIFFMAGKSGRGGHGRGGGRGGAQPGNVVVIDALPPPPPSRPRTTSRGGDDGYLHEKVDIAPDGENGNDHAYGTNDEPEPDTRPARNKEAIKKKRSKKSNKRSKDRKRKHSSSDSDSSSSSLLRLPLLPLIPLLLTLIPTPTLPITARTRARRSSK